jgi:transposase
VSEVHAPRAANQTFVKICPSSNDHFFRAKCPGPRLPGIKQLLADKGYDTDAIRAFLKERGVKPVIPGKANRKKKIRHDKKTYKGRNVVERCFCRLKDFRRIATRYDKLAQNFFSALCFVATLA